jgi:hypothetical protein
MQFDPEKCVKRDLRELNEWLQRLHPEHPWRFNALSVGLALLILTAAALLKWLLEWLLRN